MEVANAKGRKKNDPVFCMESTCSDKQISHRDKHPYFSDESPTPFKTSWGKVDNFEFQPLLYARQDSQRLPFMVKPKQLATQNEKDREESPCVGWVTKADDLLLMIRGQLAHFARVCYSTGKCAQSRRQIRTTFWKKTIVASSSTTLARQYLETKFNLASASRKNISQPQIEEKN